MSFTADVGALIETSDDPLLTIAPWWRRVPLGEVATILNGFPFESRFFGDKGAPLLRIRNITTGEIDTRYSGPVPHGYWVKRGDLVVGMDGDFNSREWDGEDSLLNQRVCKISADERFLDLRFLAIVLPAYLEAINRETHSTTVKHLSSRTLQQLPIPLPPRSEQLRLVQQLARLATHTRQARCNLERLPQLVARYKQALLNAAFRGELTKDWRSKEGDRHPSGSQLLHAARDAHLNYWQQHHRGKYTPHEPLSGDDKILDLPSSWTWAAAEEIVLPGSDIVYGIIQPGPKLASGVPYVRGTDIEDGIIKIDQLLFTSQKIADKYSRAALCGGDVLLGIIRATKVAIVPDILNGANITQGTARFRPSEAILTAFLARWLESKEAQAWLHSKYRGIDMPGLNLRDVRRCPVPIAPLEEQAEIVRRLDVAFTKIDRLHAEGASAGKLVNRLDRAVLCKAVRGELVSQDLADEPAEMLLQRAQASRPKKASTQRERLTAEA